MGEVCREGRTGTEAAGGAQQSRAAGTRAHRAMWMPRRVLRGHLGRCEQWAARGGRQEGQGVVSGKRWMDSRNIFQIESASGIFFEEEGFQTAFSGEYVELHNLLAAGTVSRSMACFRGRGSLDSDAC